MVAQADTVIERNGRPLVRWRTELFIEGRFVTGKGEALAVENPATEEILAEIRTASLEQIDATARAARRAFESGAWRDPELRRAVIGRIADLLAAREAEFRSALVQETGTPVTVGQGLQFAGPLDMIRYYAGRSDVDRTRSLGQDLRTPASESLIRYEPIGVVAAIGAYNNPLLYMASKAVAALAAGCACIFLPSALAPLTALLFAEIARDAGVPPGILSIIAGGPEVAKALTLHAEVDKISLTGSVEVGRQVMIQAAAGIKGVVLELGGKSAGIILPGADLAKVAMPLHGRYLRNAGQGCQSPTRILVPKSLFGDFVDVSRETYGKIKVGDPWDATSLVGPLISQGQRAKVEGFVDRAIGAGGNVLAGGGRPAIERGWFMNGALIGGMSNHAEISRNELFGPVAVAIPYDDVGEAVAIANESELGLAASIFGPLDEAKAVAKRLRVGTVYINGGGNFRVDSVIAGWKHSGLGKEWGEDGLMEFLEPQHIQWVL